MEWMISMKMKMEFWGLNEREFLDEENFVVFGEGKWEKGERIELEESFLW